MTIQWIGVAAAAIVIGVGVRDVYVEITAPPLVESIVEREQIPETVPEVPPAEEPWFERPEESPSEIEQQPTPVVSASTLAPVPANPRPAADPIAVYRPVPAIQPERVARDATVVESEQTTSLTERLRASLGDPQELADPSGLEEPPPSTDQVASDTPEEAELAQATGPPDSIGGVVVLSLRWNGRDTPAGVRESSKHDVTLVTIGGRSGPTQVVRQPNGPEVSDAVSGIYYFRLLAGSSAEPLDPESHGLFGDDLRVLPSGKADPWKGLLVTPESAGDFGMPSAVALDPVWLPARYEHRQSDFVAAVGGQLYEVSVAGAPSAYDGWHEMSIEIASRDPHRGSRAIVELQVLVQQNRFVVLQAPGRNDSVIDTTLVAFTPLFSPVADTIGAMDSMFDTDPRAELIPIEGPQPVLPVGFVLDPTTFDALRLRVLVLSTGEPLSVVATETASPGGEYLVEPIVSAVRQWRFYPPALGPGTIGGYFDITVGPDGEIRPFANADLTAR